MAATVKQSPEAMSEMIAYQLLIINVNKQDDGMYWRVYEDDGMYWRVYNIHYQNTAAAESRQWS